MSTPCRCPSCGHRFTPAPPVDPVEALTRELREQCERRREWVSLDGRVSALTAALLLGKSPGTLANWRAGKNPLPYHRMGHGPITYRLADIAAFIVRGREE